MLEEHTIVSAFRLLLDRDPESMAVIADKQANLGTMDDLVADLISSKEFASRNRDHLFKLF